MYKNIKDSVVKKYIETYFYDDFVRTMVLMLDDNLECRIKSVF